MLKKLNEYIMVINAVVNRNHIILTDFSRRAQKNSVNLHWWKIDGKKQNIGDQLSPIVVDYMKKMNGITSTECKNKKNHFFAIGSIIDSAYQDATIWGSGFLRSKNILWWKIFRRLDIRCIRGPKTRNVLIKNGYECPEVYGDPAVLLPYFYQPQNRICKYKYIVIPHMKCSKEYPNMLSPLTDNWKSFIDELNGAELIISSSLHGIILSEAYGIPAIFLNDCEMDLFKFQDYYYSTGRKEFPIARTLEDALKMKPTEIPDFSNIRKNLINTFPIDIWSR